MKIATILAITTVFISQAAFGQTSTSTSTATATNTDTVNVTAGGSGGAGGTGGSSVSVAGGGAGGHAHATGGNAYQNQKQNQSISKSGNSRNSYVSEAQQRNPVSTAFAVPLVASGDCMGSSSVGGQGVGFGLSVGSTWNDTDCQRRHDAVVLYNMNQYAASLALMCQNASIAKAMKTAKTPCISDENDIQPTSASVPYISSSYARKYPTSSPSNY